MVTGRSLSHASLEPHDPALVHFERLFNFPAEDE